MKSIKLIGEPLVLARSIQSMYKHSEAQNAALAEKFERDQKVLAQQVHEALTEKMVQLCGLVGVDLAEQRPQIDLRYVEDHDVAFLLIEDDEPDAPATAPGEH